MIAVQSRHMAKGILIELFQLAQEFWFPSRQLIPLDRFEAAGLPAVLYAPGGLCEIRGDSVYVRGSDNAFSWLFEKSEAGKIGGRNSAVARKEKYGTAQPGKKTQKRRSKLEAASKQPSNDIEAPEASLLSSLSSSLSSPTLSSNSLVRGAHGVSDPHAPPVDSITPTAQVWRAYKNAYRRRYHHDPTYNAKVMGQMRAFVGRVPASEAPLIAEFFVSHPKTFYVQKLHDFGLCLSDAESLRTQWLAGSPVTDGMVKEYRQKASQPREKGIAEILAEQSQPISQQVLIDARGHDDSV